MAWRRLAWICLIFAAFFVAKPAAAQRGAGKAVSPPGSTPVLTFESDDADEQAEAFSIALRSRLKNQPGFIGSDSIFSLAIMSAALRCKPDAACLLRMADQMKTDRFFWGRFTRAGKNQVTVEAHVWQRGKPDSAVTETYSDELHDAQNEKLLRIVNRIFERLIGVLTTGTVVVRAGNSGGTVLIDGTATDKLTNGQTTLELKPGSHTVEVRVPGYLAPPKPVNVTLGGETVVTFTLSLPPEPPLTPEMQASNNSTRRLIAYGLLGAGGVAAIVGIVYAVRWFILRSDVSDLTADQFGIKIRDATQPSVHVANACDGYADATAESKQRMADACRLDQDGRSLSTIAWVATSAGVALGGAGAILLYSTPKESKLQDKSTPKSGRAGAVRVVPSIGPHEGMLQIGAQF